MTDSLPMLEIQKTNRRINIRNPLVDSDCLRGDIHYQYEQSTSLQSQQPDFLSLSLSRAQCTQTMIVVFRWFAIIVHLLVMGPIDWRLGCASLLRKFKSNVRVSNQKFQGAGFQDIRTNLEVRSYFYSTMASTGFPHSCCSRCSRSLALIESLSGVGASGVSPKSALIISLRNIGVIAHCRPRMRRKSSSRHFVLTASYAPTIISFLVCLISRPCHSFYHFPFVSFKPVTAAPTSCVTHMSSDASTADPQKAASDNPRHVVIAGAGVIGISTAFYLAQNHGIRTTLVDPTGTIAPAASGKAGGFLALDWNDGTFTQDLTRRSFALHQLLADQFGPDSIQYRRLTCAAISVVDPRNGLVSKRPSGKKLEGIEWAQPKDGGDEASPFAMGVRTLGNEETIAQVHPKMLCQRMWEEISKPVEEGGVGATLVKGKVIGAVHEDVSSARKLVGAKLDGGEVLEADALLFACGPWTTDTMKGVKYHSAVIPTDDVLSQCVFFSGCGDPEVYVRPDSTAYCTGFPDPPIRVKEKPGEESVRPDKISTILESVREASGGKKSLTPLTKDPVLEQACYLPTTDDSIPLMGELPLDIAGGERCYIATGHTCWGILLGPASGEAMASLIATGKSSEVDLQFFDPSRYSNFKLVPE